MILFFDASGPLLKFSDRTLYIEDLNLEMKTKWRMSRWEIIKLGLRCLWAGTL